MRIFKIIYILITFSLLGCSEQNHPPKNVDSGFIQVKQGKLFYQQFGSDGTPIIVLHGGPGLDQTYLLPQMQVLAKNHQVVFYDQRGSGQSLETPFTSALININQFTQDLEAVRKQLGFNKFILIGHSWGGFLAMNYSIHYPQHVSALILLDSAPADYKGQKAFITEFTKRTQPIKSEIAPLFNPKEFNKLNAIQIAELYRTLLSVYFFDKNDASKLTLDINEKSAKSGVNVKDIMMQTSWLKPGINLFPQLKKITVPTLIIHGEEDIVPLWTAQQIQKAIPNAKISIIKQCGHFPFIETPDPFFSTISQFVDGAKGVSS